MTMTLIFLAVLPFISKAPLLPMVCFAVLFVFMFFDYRLERRSERESQAFRERWRQANELQTETYHEWYQNRVLNVRKGHK